jgi:hypothetical protein
LPCYDTPTETFALRPTTVKLPAVNGQETFALLPTTSKLSAPLIVEKANVPEPLVVNA